MSGRTFSFEVNRTSSAPPATLFRMKSDGARWSEWGKPLIAQSAGRPRPGGVGAVRKVGLWPVLMREETVEYEQDRWVDERQLRRWSSARRPVWRRPSCTTCLCGASRHDVGDAVDVLVVLAVLAVLGGSVVTVSAAARRERRCRRRSRRDAQRVLRGTPAPDATVTYSTFDGEPLRLGIYRPHATDQPAPGLRSSSAVKSIMQVTGSLSRAAGHRWFAEHGWLTVTVDYALSTPDRHMWDVVQPPARVRPGVGELTTRSSAAAMPPAVAHRQLVGPVVANNAASGGRRHPGRHAAGAFPRCRAVSDAVSGGRPRRPATATMDPSLGDTSRDFDHRLFSAGRRHEFPQRYTSCHLVVARRAPTAPPTIPPARCR